MTDATREGRGSRAEGARLLVPAQGRGLDAASGPRDYLATLKLKHDHEKKPLWVCPNGRILLESGSPVEKEAVDFLVAIAEPRCRTRFLQEYQLTAYSLYAGASMGLRTSEILSAMDRFSKTELPPDVRRRIHDETSRYGKVRAPPQRSSAPSVSQHILTLSRISAAAIAARIRCACRGGAGRTQTDPPSAGIRPSAQTVSSDRQLRPSAQTAAQTAARPVRSDRQIRPS